MGILGALACAWGSAVCANQTDVTVQVRIGEHATGRIDTKGKAIDASNVVVWLKPLDKVEGAVAEADEKQRPKLIQRDKKFEPHLLVVQTGTTVDFPNRDPFFHNVFSLFDGKRFDLGLYEAGATSSVKFDKSGVSFLFCNIHPEMSAVVVSLDTPYYGVSNRAGSIIIANVPEGRYELHVWYEKSLPETLGSLTRVVHVDSSSNVIGPIVVLENQNFTTAHKNKYGQDYAPPPNNTYSHH
jgi:plastocyanin